MLTELWEVQHNFYFSSDHYLYDTEVTSDVNLATAATKAQRANFRFPAKAKVGIHKVECLKKTKNFGKTLLR